MNTALNKTPVQATINGEPRVFLCAPGQVLAETLRDELQLTGTKLGCNTGDCGACSVLVNDRLVCSCLVLAVEVEGQSVQTWRVLPREAYCTRSSRNCWSTAACNAVSAPRVWWSPPKPCCRRTRTLRKKRSGTGWPATSAAAPATTKSLRPCWTRPALCAKGRCHEREAGI